MVRSRDSAVGIATAYGLDDRGVGVRIPVRSRNFCSLRRQDRLWGSHSPHPMDTEGSVAWGKEAGAWSWPLPTSAEVKKTWIYTAIPPYVFMA
jgi:hypothetical protein